MPPQPPSRNARGLSKETDGGGNSRQQAVTHNLFVVGNMLFSQQVFIKINHLSLNKLLDSLDSDPVSVIVV